MSPKLLPPHQRRRSLLPRHSGKETRLLFLAPERDWPPHEGCPRACPIQRVTLQLPVLDDLHAVQVGLMQLGEAVGHGEIDHRKGRLLLAMLRLAASNIKAQGSWLERSTDA